MELSALQTTRDWLVIIAGILWAIVILAVAAVFAVLWWFTRKYMGKGVQFLHKRVHPILQRVHTQAVVLQDRTSRLPGNTPMPEGEARPVSGRSRPRLPWPRRRRRRLPLVS